MTRPPEKSGSSDILSGNILLHSFGRLFLLSRKKLPLSIFGFAAVVLIVGPLLDTSSLFTMSSMINTSSVAAVYLAGLPVNLIHGAATFLTLYLCSRPLLEKLDRLKLKYGMLEGTDDAV